MGRSDRGQGPVFRRNSATQTVGVLQAPSTNDQATMTMEEPESTDTELEEVDRSPVRDSYSHREPQTTNHHFQAQAAFETSSYRMPYRPYNLPKNYEDGFGFHPQYNSLHETLHRQYAPHRYYNPRLHEYWHQQNGYNTNDYFRNYGGLHNGNDSFEKADRHPSFIQVVDPRQDSAVQKLQQQMKQLGNICASVIKKRDKRAELRDSLALQLQSIEEQTAMLTQLRIRDLQDKSPFLAIDGKENNSRRQGQYEPLPDRFDPSVLGKSRKMNDNQNPKIHNHRKRRSGYENLSTQTTSAFQHSSIQSNDRHTSNRNEDMNFSGGPPLGKGDKGAWPVDSLLEWRESLLKFYNAIEKLLLRLLSSGYRDSECTYDLMKIRENTVRKLRDADEILEIMK